MSIFEPFIIVVSRKEVEEADTSLALGIFQRLLESPEIAKAYQEKVDIVFHGYDEDSRELFEIPEVRNYVHRLDNDFPFWLYFLSKEYSGLQAILLCFLPPYLTEEAKGRIYPGKINDLLLMRWFPALNHICTFVGLNDPDIEAITERTIQYILH